MLCRARFLALLLFAACGLLPAHAQQQPADPGQLAEPLYPPPALANIATVPPTRPPWRDTHRYPYMGSGRALRYGQIVAYAMQLYDYCDSRTVSDDFVKSRLDWFSKLTERTETCDTLLDYLGSPPRLKTDETPPTPDTAGTVAPAASPSAPAT